jgi:hypothetical protein
MFIVGHFLEKMAESAREGSCHRGGRSGARSLPKQRRVTSWHELDTFMLSSLLKPIGKMLAKEQDSILVQLEKAVNSREPKDTEAALLLIFPEFENDEEFRRQTIPALIHILTYPNHYRHEDIVRMLQQAKDSRAVDALYNATLTIPEYQDSYDGGAALVRKCTWALADIGNMEAYSNLQLIAKNDNPEIAGYAQKRIDLWNEELPRKAYQFKP